MSETSDFSDIPTAYPPATGFDSVYVGEVLTLSRDAVEPLEAVPLQQLEAAIAGVANGFNVQDFGALGNGVHDDAADINTAIAAAAGHGPLTFPAAQTLGAPAIYLIGSVLLVPSNSHLIIEAGATIKIADGANCGCMAIEANASNIAIDLYGTLDGNAPNQPTTGSPSGGITGNGSVPCSNVYIRGGRSGVITNFKNWPISLSIATNCEVNGLTLSNSGNSIEFAGISTRINVISGSYTTSSGAITINTGTVPHGINVGDTFTYVAASGSAVFVQGEYVALTVPDAFTVTTTGAAGLVGGNPALTTGRVGTCSKCYNVGFVDCVASTIRDLPMGFYGGVVGGYIRNCEMQAGAGGPFIFSDAGQPGSNEDCEISGCYTHDSFGAGPTVTSNQFGIQQHNSRIYDNIVRNCARGGITVGACDGVEVYGNSLHNNMPGFEGASQQSGQLLVGGTVTKANIWGNTIRDPGQSSAAQSVIAIVPGSSTYTSATGAVSLTTSSAHGINVGDRFIAFNLFGQGNYLALNGWQTATTGTAGTTVNYMAATGLGTITFLGTSGRVIAFTFAVMSTLVAGTYTSDASGNLSLTTAAPHKMTTGDTFVLGGVGGTGVPAYMNAQFAATAGTTGTTLNFVILPNVTMTITSGEVFPANFGIAIDTPDYTRIADNSIGDYQFPAFMTTCIGGTWGLLGSSYGNYFGRRAAVNPDTSIYASGSVNGLNYDLVFSLIIGNASIAGSMNFQGNTQQSSSVAGYFQPRGLTPGWNLNSGSGDVDFFCGRDGGGPGGFNFLQVAAITVSAGTYTSGSGAVVLTTGVPHGMSLGSVFTVSDISNSSAAVSLLDGSQTATGGTGGTTLNYTGSTGLTLLGPITGGTVTPTGGAPVGVVSGTYNSGTGAVSLTTVTSHGISVSGTFFVTNITDGDPDVTKLNGTHTATAGTTGSTLDFTDTTGLSITFPINGATIMPAGTAGGVVDTTMGVSGSLLANDGYGNTRLGGALAFAPQVAALANAGTVTVSPHKGFVLIQNGSSIATASVVLPSPRFRQFADGAELELNFQNAVGALTITAAVGAGVVNPPTSVASAGTSVSFINVGTVWTRRIMV